MKFQKGLSKELCAMLQCDLQQYIKETIISKDEHRELCRWVQAGNSPYDNGWGIAADTGAPMDFIRAKRIVEDGLNVIPAYDTMSDEPIFFARDDVVEVSSEILPF